MVRTQRKSLLAGVFACGLSSVAMAGTTASAGQSQDLQAQVSALKAQVAQLQQQQGENWLNQRRKEEVKGLVRDVLKDAGNRTSLADQGMTAGYDHGFYMASADGNFKLSIGGQFDFRYIYNKTRDPHASGLVGNENVQGFQTRRAKFWFTGNVYSKNLKYKILGAFSRHGHIDAEDLWADYNFGNGMDVKFGQYTTPFLREYLISSSKQQAVERSMVTQYFGTEFTKGVTVNYKADKFHLTGMFSGGPHSRNTDFYGKKDYEYGLIGRAEFLAAGNWKEFGDYQDWSGEPFGLLIGGGAQYDAGERGGNGVHKADLTKFTADVSAKVGGGFNAYAAFYGQHVSPRDDSAITTPHGTQLGFLVQAGQFVIPDKMDVFARYEYANLEGNNYSGKSNTGSPTSSTTGGDKLSMITVGTNWYMHKHNAKFTLDGVYALKALPFGNDGAGLLTDYKKGELAIRAQFQLKF